MSVEVRLDSSAFRTWFVHAGARFQADAKQALGQAAGMAVQSAQHSNLWTSRTGTLRSSITREPHGAWGWKIKASAKHAAYVEFGTKPHAIVARRARVLRFIHFKAGGELMFRRAVWHPGTKPTHFLWRAVDWAGDALDEMLVRAMARAFR